MFKDMSKIYNEECQKGMLNLANSYGKFADCIITSPPYAEQRKNQYGGINEKDYPHWTLEWMNIAETLLKEDGSILINIRPHLKDGQISDYILKTRLLLRENGWIENEELIWIKPDSPPLGSIKRPRRAWESILWFSKCKNPYCNTKSESNISNRIGYENNKFEEGGTSHIHAGQNKAKVGFARFKDYIECGTGRVEKGFSNSAMYPPEISEYLVNLFCPKDGIVVDPFMGSGTTIRQSIRMNRGFVGFEVKDRDFQEADDSILKLIKNDKLENIYKDFIESNVK